MQYAYPGILYRDEGWIAVKIPDLPGCFTYGKDVAEALLLARDAVEMWLWDAERKGEPIPPASDKLTTEAGETFTLIPADTTPQITRCAKRPRRPRELKFGSQGSKS